MIHCYKIVPKYTMINLCNNVKDGLAAFMNGEISFKKNEKQAT